LGDAVERRDATIAGKRVILIPSRASQVMEYPVERLRAVQSSLHQELQALRSRLAVDCPGNPALHGFKVYAQTDEDGIIEHILERLPRQTKTFIEIGCGNGLENNSHFLLLKNYKGCWVDGNAGKIAFIESELGGLKFDRLLVEAHVVTTANIEQIISNFCEFIGTTEPDFFSLDIDGNDLPVLKEALKTFRPLTICAEYNPKFPPPFEITMPYNPEHKWTSDDFQGASLEAFCNLLSPTYKLVCCNLCGVNAFFVRGDVATSYPDYSSKQLYQPFREHLIDLRSFHRPSLKWLRAILR
jgi:hypothetical protein